jgi:hypothetical protein
VTPEALRPRLRLVIIPRMAARRIRHAIDLLSATSVPTNRAAMVLAREPDSPVTEAVKLWGDDEEPFKNLITAKTRLARRWRKIMYRLLVHLEPDRKGNTVYRGWSFANDLQRTEFMRSILQQGFFVNSRIGMSATKSLAVSTSATFLNRHGAIWEIRAPRKARDLEPIFAAIGAKYHEQREVIFPRGTRLGLVEVPKKLRVVRDGQIVRVPYFVFEEA